MMPGLSKLLKIPPQKIVYIAEYCGGGFGSKGNPYPAMVIPAYMAKKTGRAADYHPEAIRAAAEEFFDVQPQKKIGRYPFWILDAK